MSHLSCTHATGLGYPLAGNIYVITTHGLFVNDGINELRDSGLIKKLICNDSHVNTQHINDDLVEVRSIDKLIPSVI